MESRSRSAGGHRKLIRASNPQTQSNQVRLQRFTIWQSSLPARESHYSDRKSFCNPKIDPWWSIAYNAEIYFHWRGRPAFSKCKQLCCERISDHIKKILNPQKDRVPTIFIFAVCKISLKTASFLHTHKPFAICFTQYFPLALAWSYHK